MFSDILKKRLIQDGGNYFNDNFDYYVFGKNKSFKKKIVNAFKRVLFTKPVFAIAFSIRPIYINFFFGTLFGYKKYLQPMEFFYDNLASDESKELFLKLVEFRLLGYLKVRLPLSTPAYWQGIKEMEGIGDESKALAVNCFPWKLPYHDLSSKGLPIKVYISSKSAYTTFVLQQYIKVETNRNLGPKEGDVVLDMGACYGDTAILFSYLVGKKGKIYSFEFIPGNIDVFKKNLELNPEYKDQVEIVPHPLWNESDKKIYYKDAGAASRISFSDFAGSEGETATLSVDDFVERYKITKLDFIKADIEGAEPIMLKGAVKTIKNFRPTLAISIYHNMNDFTGIIKQISDMGAGYKFYLGHYTIYASETILYAVPE